MEEQTRQEKKEKNKLQTVYHFLKKNIRWIVVFLAVVLFVEIVEELFENEIYRFDDFIYHYVSKLISEPMTTIFKIITSLSGAIVVLLVCTTMLLTSKNKKIRIMCFCKFDVGCFIEYFIEKYF